MNIDVWSDVVCPWCFIGWTRLKKAVAASPHAEQITIRHRAFQLQPDISEVLPTAELLATKYRTTPENVAKMQENVCEIADGEGLCYQLNDTLSGNTADAHRLLIWAAGSGKQEELLAAMFSAYFEQSLPLFSHEDLLAITDRVGLDRDEALALLNSERFVEEVESDARTAASLGASGVPFFVLDNRYGISGAQNQEVFSQVLEEAWKTQS